MGDNQNIELQIPLTAATEATSRTQKQSCTFWRKCFASLISGGIVVAIIIAVILLNRQDTTPKDDHNDPTCAPCDYYEDYYDYLNPQNNDYVDVVPQTGGDTSAAEIKDVS